MWADPADGRSPTPVPPGSTLRTGDEIWFQVTVNQPSFLYLVSYEAGGQHLIMYPVEGAVVACPDRPTRLPARPSQHFQLNPSTGMENPYVIASVRPLPTPTVTVQRLVGRVHPSPPVLTSIPRRGTQAQPPRADLPSYAAAQSCPMPAEPTPWQASPGAYWGPGLGVVHLPFLHQ